MSIPDFKIETIKVDAKTELLKATWNYLPPRSLDTSVGIIRGLSMSAYRVGVHGPTKWSIYELSGEIKEWVESQPSEMWLNIDDPNTIKEHSFAISPELESWLKIKFM